MLCAGVELVTVKIKASFICPMVAFDSVRVGSDACWQCFGSSFKFT